MRKNYVVAALICFGTLNGSAQILNSNFENWSQTSISQDSAHHWSSTNHAVHNIISFITTLYKGNSAYSGTAAAELNTAGFGFVQTPLIGILVNGKAKLDFDAVKTSYVSGGGTAITANPTALEGYYKINGPYDGLVKVLVSKYDTVKHKRDTIALNSMGLSSTATTYASFNLPITYMTPGITGDSVTVVFYSSDPAVVPSTYCSFSTLVLDSLHLVENVVDGSIAGINNLKTNDTVNTTQTIEAWVYNRGNTSISNFDLSYMVNGGAAVTETFTGTILAADSALHTFSQTWTPGSAGNYDICVYLNGIANDIAVLNDTSCLSIRSNLGVEKFADQQLQIFPNPANTHVEVKLPEPARLLIYNHAGSVVRALNVDNSFYLNTIAYPQGIYLLKVIDPKSGATLGTSSMVVKH